jgi:hypothetical protein
LRFDYTPLLVRMSGLVLLPALALSMAGWAGCGASAVQGKPQVTSEFGVREGQLFEDGIDLIEDPQGLEGQWRDDWENDLNERISKSDLIASGTVTTLRTDIDLEKHTSYRVVFAIERVFKGEKPSSELTLVSIAGAGGYASIERDRQHMLSRKMVVFLKYADASAGSGSAASGNDVIAHFHLSPPSDVVLARVREFDDHKRPNRVIIVEHKD